MAVRLKRSWYERMYGVDRETARRIGGAGTFATTANVVKLSDQLTAIEQRLITIEASLATLRSEQDL